MATTTFLGADDNTEAFNLDGRLVLKKLLRAETRLRDPFPSPSLEVWRRAGLQYCAAPVTTGRNDLATRGRVLLVCAHDADLGTIFTSLGATAPRDVAGYYVDRRSASSADAALQTAYAKAASAMVELEQLGVPRQHRDLLLTRLGSSSYAHRVAGLCATVYLAALIFSDAKK